MSKTVIKVVVPGRFSFMNVFEPRVMQEGSAPKFGCTLLIPKTDKKTIDYINAKAAQCLVEHKDAIKGVKSTTKKNPLRDGDVKISDYIQENDGKNDGKWDSYKGMMYIAANAPEDSVLGIYDKTGNDILKKTEIKSGDYGYMSMHFYGFNSAGNNGVAAGLQAVKLVKVGEALGGSFASHKDFADVDLDIFSDDTASEGEGDTEADGEDW